MSNKYLEDIKKAQQDYINAENTHYEYVEEKKKKIVEINKFYDDIFSSNKEKMWDVLEAKSKAIAKAIENTPQWYKVEEIFIPAMDCAYQEEVMPYFYKNSNKLHTTNAMDDSFDDIFEEMTWDSTNVYWNDMGDGRKAPIPAIRLNASDSDDKLEKLAQNLGDYINSIHSARAKSAQASKEGIKEEVRFRVDHCFNPHHESFYSTVFSPEPGQYTMDVVVNDEKQCVDYVGCVSLLELLQEVRRNYWYGYKESFH